MSSPQEPTSDMSLPSTVSPISGARVLERELVLLLTLLTPSIENLFIMPLLKNLVLRFKLHPAIILLADVVVVLIEPNKDGNIKRVYN